MKSSLTIFTIFLILLNVSTNAHEAFLPSTVIYKRDTVVDTLLNIQYDTNLRISKKEYKYEEPEVSNNLYKWRILEYSYNTSGQLICLKKTADLPSPTIGYLKYSYDVSGRLISTIDSITPTQRLEYKYYYSQTCPDSIEIAEESKQIITSKYNTDCKLIQRQNQYFEYNENGKLSHVYEINSNTPPETTLHTEYSYDSMNRTYRIVNKSGKYEWSSLILYDSIPSHKITKNYTGDSLNHITDEYFDNTLNVSTYKYQPYLLSFLWSYQVDTVYKLVNSNTSAEHSNTKNQHLDVPTVNIFNNEIFVAGLGLHKIMVYDISGKEVKVSKTLTNSFARVVLPSKIACGFYAIIVKHKYGTYFKKITFVK
jgi:hypothetical protein